jgi:hypothetical protein
MYVREIFSFRIPMTNIECYGYSIYKDNILLKTVYYKKDGSVMTIDEAKTLIDSDYPDVIIVE